MRLDELSQRPPLVSPRRRGEPVEHELLHNRRRRQSGTCRLAPHAVGALLRGPSLMPLGRGGSGGRRSATLRPPTRCSVCLQPQTAQSKRWQRCSSPTCARQARGRAAAQTRVGGRRDRRVTRRRCRRRRAGAFRRRAAPDRAYAHPRRITELAARRNGGPFGDYVAGPSAIAAGEPVPGRQDWRAPANAAAARRAARPGLDHSSTPSPATAARAAAAAELRRRAAAAAAVGTIPPCAPRSTRRPTSIPQGAARRLRRRRGRLRRP